MDKILWGMGNGSGTVEVTNDGATILRSVGVDNPAAKVFDLSDCLDIACIPAPAEKSEFLHLCRVFLILKSKDPTLRS